MIACFSDGTLRLFDLTGTFHSHVNLQLPDSTTSSQGSGQLEDGLFDMDSSSSEDEEELSLGNDNGSRGSVSSIMGKHRLQSPSSSAAGADTPTTKTGKRNRYVLSKENQRFGAVASQIHAKGVITSLLMDVDVAQDGEYCFAGVLRGSMEMVAVHLGAVEEYLDRKAAAARKANKDGGEMEDNVDLLDLITVFRRSDAKLRGFGACTRLRNGSATKPPQYLLFTGKTIKNIHIFRFEPPLDPRKDNRDDDAKWIQLYDCPTNGNTITHLQFRHDSHGLLQGITKSDNQKLRVWDLSYEQHHGNPKNPFFAKRSLIKTFATTQEKNQPTIRPKRPPFCDVAHSENTLGVCGGFSVCCGGSTQYNQMSIVPLDVANLQAAFNHTELALPLVSAGGSTVRTSRRQQRGELKSVVAVAGMAMDPGYVLLEVCDGSMIQFSHGEHGQPKVEMSSLLNSELIPQQEGISRKMCVGKMGSAGVVTAAVATYNGGSGKGTIVMKPLNGEVLVPSSYRQKGFWGFSRHLRLTKEKKKMKTLLVEPSSKASITPSSAEPRQELNISNSRCASPRTNTDISNWTHPPTSASVQRTQTPATPSQGPTTSVKLFGSERSHSAPTLSPPPAKTAANYPKKRPPKEKELSSAHVVTAKKKRKMIDSSLLRTPLASGPAVVALSSIQAKPGIGKPPLKRIKIDGKDILQIKKVKNLKRPSSSDNVTKTTTSSATPASKGRTTPPTIPVFAKQAKVSTTQPLSGSSTSLVPGTPTIQSPVEPIGKGSPQASTVNAPGAAQQVSPDPKEASPTAAITATNVTLARKEKNSITQYLEKQPQKKIKLGSKSKEEPAVVASPTIPRKPSDGKLSSKSTAEPTAVASPTIPRKPTDGKPKQSATREVAEAMCELGTATKNMAAAPKRTAVETSTLTATGNANKTLRGKSIIKASRKLPKRQLAGSQQYKDQCSEQEERLKCLKQNHLPGTSVEARMGLLAASEETGNHAAKQELARMVLAASHRANHEMLLTRVVHAAQFTCRALKQAMTLGDVEEAEESFQESFRSYYEILEEVLWRQSEEATSLADRQRWEKQGSPIPNLQVTFPFFSVFDEVIACVNCIVQTARAPV